MSFLEIQKAIQVARFVLKKFPQITTKLKTTKKSPIDVYFLAKELGIVVKEENIEDKEISGAFKRKNKDGRSVILLNSNHSHTRRRFSLAHELAHYFLHTSKDTYVDTQLVYLRDENSSNASDIREIQANQFAAELLMPSDMMKEDIRLRMPIDDEEKLSKVISELAEKYDVSTQAMTIKVGKLIS